MAGCGVLDARGDVTDFLEFRSRNDDGGNPANRHAALQGRRSGCGSGTASRRIWDTGSWAGTRAVCVMECYISERDGWPARNRLEVSACQCHGPCACAGKGPGGERGRWLSSGKAGTIANPYTSVQPSARALAGAKDGWGNGQAPVRKIGLTMTRRCMLGAQGNVGFHSDAAAGGIP